MKKCFVFPSIFVLILSCVGFFTHPSVYPSGLVEKQIRGFGPQLCEALTTNNSFVKTSKGYLPTAPAPTAPTGLKPQELQAWNAFAQLHPAVPPLVPTFPEHYSSGMQIRGQGMCISIRPLGSQPVSAQIENGKLVYRDVYPSTDSLNVVTAGRSEEFLLLHDTTAPKKFEYELTNIIGVKDVTLSNNAIHFINANGQQLQIEAPWLMESSSGKKVANTVQWQLNNLKGKTLPRLALVVTNADKLHYPVVIDPTWVVPNGSLHTARYAHTATLLNNGQILVAGGYNDSLQVLNSTELYDPTTGLWTVKGNLNFARESATATLLLNGQVLIVGGEGPQGALSSSEIYNPTSGTWTPAGNLLIARGAHTATLLPNGQVLATAGFNYAAGGFLNSSELYNPVTGIWTLTGNLNVGRSDHSATLLRDGHVLVAGGIGNGYALLNSAEIYDSTTGTWTTTENLKDARHRHTATLLLNGKVLVAGGEGGRYLLNSTELYDPATGVWKSTSDLNYMRSVHTATLLPNGQVLVEGGYGVSPSTGRSGPFNSRELYDPSSDTWKATDNLTDDRWYHTATLLHNGQVLVVGGSNTSGYLDTTELYTSSTGTWRATDNLNSLRGGHTATLLSNGQVLVTGGYSAYNSSGISTSSELYNPNTGTWTMTGNLNIGRFGHTATLLQNGYVLVAGGSNYVGPLSSAEIYNPFTGTWSITGNLHNSRWYHIATLLANGQVLVSGGNINTRYTSDHSVKSTELYSPATGTWSLAGNLNIGRWYPTATLLPDGQVLIAGGINNSFNQILNSAELYNPATRTWKATGNLNIGRYGNTATLLPNGQVLVAGGTNYYSGNMSSAELYNPATGTWAKTGNLNMARNKHTATLLLNGQVLVAGGYDDATQQMNSTELYNPATGIWTTTGNLATARYGQTATLLLDGQVLVAGGGYNFVQTLNSAELYDLGLGYSGESPPQLNPVAALNTVTPLSLTGTNFTGVSEGSGGATNTSSSNIPVVQLQSLVNEQVIELPLDSNTGFSSTSFASSAPGKFVPGYALLTMFVNGTPSLSQIVSYSLITPQTLSHFVPTVKLSATTKTYAFTALATSGLPVTYTVISGPATVSGRMLTLTGSGTVVVTATQAGNNIFAPVSATETITVTALVQTILNFPTAMRLPSSSLSFQLKATASSKLPITFEVISGPATVAGNTLSFSSAGTVVVIASQAGNNIYAPVNAKEIITVK